MPKISVLMPVYNAEKYLAEAIESILNQTFTDFEFIIINDGSTDKSEQIIKSYDDKRIRYVKNQENLGLIKTLNKGIDACQAEFIARMDADDIARKDRLELQHCQLSSNENMVLSASYVQCFGKRNEIFKALNHNLAFIIGETMVSHPTVMMRKSVLDKNNLRYDENYPHAEDFKLWNELKKFGSFHIISEPLLKYRVHGESVSIAKRDKQVLSRNKVILEEWEKLLKRPPYGYEKDFLSLNYRKLTVNELGKILKILQQNNVSYFITDKIILDVLKANVKSKKNILGVLLNLRTWNIMPLVRFLINKKVA